MPSEPTGERLLARRYRLVTHVGRGGMGTVWQAHDEVLGRDVAVKEVILPHGLTDEERAVHHKRTFREARTAARLGHPGVVTVYDVVEEDDRPWIIMELIRARSLDQVIKQDGPLDARRAAEIGRQMLAALHAAHEAGVLHRDVKPSNVLITGTGRMGERAVLTDFGIATASGDATLTQTGLVMGSPAYIAPERARGRLAGPASDLWSLGVTLYAMMNGKSPFERSEPMAALIAVISDEPDPPEKGGRLIPVIEGLLRKNPDQRMDAIEAGALLDDIVRQETIDTQRTMAVEFSMDEPAREPEAHAPEPRGAESHGARPYAESYAEPYPETYAPDQPLPEEAGGPGGATTVDPVGPAAAQEARPDQLTSFDIPAGKAARTRSAGNAGDPGKAGGPKAGPGETAPDPDRVSSWRSGPRTEPAGGAAPAAHGSPGHGSSPGQGAVQHGAQGRGAQAHGGPGGPGHGTSTHFPPTTHANARPALASNRNVLIIAGIVLVLIVVVASIAFAGNGDDEKTAGKESATAPATGAAPPAPATSAHPSGSPSATPSDGLPAGFTMHDDRSGYSVPVPEGWSGPERKNGGDFFYSPDRKIYFQIDQTDDPGDSAIDDWRRQERGGSGWPGYELIGIRPTGDQPPVPDTGDGDDSADWEFTFDGDGGRQRILNRGFVTEGHGYAILLRAPDKNWNTVLSDLQPVYAFFEPADD
ncbi:serine/threonine-protein kinase [Actinomadura sp. KC345]|uniref:serine/threonine-protein kinase n=1 Tax=Actinomadura sp. KC345 TaxID=2530371 RepID=UPI001FB6AB48|nr:serine/threonine-protein kinase [Actinomadura sp. KC345]